MWKKSLIFACIFAAISASSDVLARPARGQPNYEGEVVFFKRMSTAIGPLLGPSHEFMRMKNRVKHPCVYKSTTTTGNVQCMEYTSDYDGSEWKIVIDRDRQFRVVRMFKKGARGMEPYATIWVVGGTVQNRVQLHGDEPRRYAGVTNETFAPMTPGSTGNNPIENAAQELERALGAAVPGTPLPPPKLPSFGR